MQVYRLGKDTPTPCCLPSAQCKKNYRRHKSENGKRHLYQISGIFYCAQCGDRLCGKSAYGKSGGKFAYYEHAWSQKRQACLNKKVFSCNPNRILAAKIEKRVWGEIEALLTDPALAEALIEQARKEHTAQGEVAEMDKLRSKVRAIEEQIEALAEHLTKIPKGVSPTPIFNQMQKLELLKEAAKADLDEMGRNGVCMDLPAGLREYREYLSILRSMFTLSDTPEFRSKVIKWLVHKVELLPGSYTAPLQTVYTTDRRLFLDSDPLGWM